MFFFLFSVPYFGDGRYFQIPGAIAKFWILPWNVLILDVHGLENCVLWRYVHGEGRIGICKSTDLWLFFAKSVDPPIFLFQSETTITSGKVNVNAIFTSDFVQVVKKATCLMTTENRTISPIWMNAYRPRLIQISFRTQDPKKRQAQSGIRTKIHSVFKIRESIYSKDPQSARLLRPNPSIRRKPIQPPLHERLRSLHDQRKWF